MNIFWLSVLTIECVQYHCDKHVVKMILEYTQLLYSAHHMCGTKKFKYGEPYRLTHKNHPCSVWVRQTKGNYRKLYTLLKKLCEEYTHRYGKVHACESHIFGNLMYYPPRLPEGDMTIPPMAMPDKYKGDARTFADVINAYRRYYIGDKARFAKWKGRDVPAWFC